MLKFMVVLYKRNDISRDAFREYFATTHRELASSLPGLRSYRQNNVFSDPNRKPPPWEGIAELFFDDYEAMQAAWASPQGRRATEDLGEFTDLDRTSWSVVDDITIPLT